MNQFAIHPHEFVIQKVHTINNIKVTDTIKIHRTEHEFFFGKESHTKICSNISLVKM